MLSAMAAAIADFYEYSTYECLLFDCKGMETDEYGRFRQEQETSMILIFIMQRKMHMILHSSIFRKLWLLMSDRKMKLDGDGSMN